MTKDSDLHDTKKGWSYNFIAQGIWGAGSPVISLIPSTLPASLLVAIRHGIGSILLGTNIATKHRTLLRNLPWKHILLLAVLAGALPDLLLVEAVRRCGPVVAIVLARLEIPFGVLLAHLILKEKVSRRAYIAATLAMVGSIVISYQPHLNIHASHVFYLGVLLGIGAGVTWAASSVYGKAVLNRRVDPLALTFVRLSIGSITAFLVTFMFISRPLHLLSSLPKKYWLALLFLGIFTSGIAYLAYYRSLKLIDAHISQILIGTTIVVTLIISTLIGQSVSLLQYLGIAIVLYSLYLIKPKKPVTPAD